MQCFWGVCGINKIYTTKCYHRHILTATEVNFMNTYVKYAPNVFLAKCVGRHNKGDEVVLTTKYGKENEVIIHNFIYEKDGFFYYSFVRADGFNSQEYAKNKADKLLGYAQTAHTKSEQYFQASQEGRDFLSLGEPIKVGHHSEKRHRALIERNWSRMGKSVEQTKKAENYEQRAEYWAERADKIDLSMPESLEYFAFELEKAREHHKFLKENPAKRTHSYSLTYANKKVKEMQKQLDLATKLWG